MPAPTNTSPRISSAIGKAFFISFTFFLRLRSVPFRGLSDLPPMLTRVVRRVPDGANGLVARGCHAPAKLPRPRRVFGERLAHQASLGGVDVTGLSQGTVPAAAAGRSAPPWECASLPSRQE